MNGKIHSLASLVNLRIHGVAQAQEPTDALVSHGDTIVVTAAEQNLQALSVSTIIADEIHKNPIACDVSEIICTMPGVNLTGNSTSGQRGNNRQVDTRGMGPEGTLILIDGKSISSRNSVRQGWCDERGTRGDISWVPPEMIECTETLYDLAATRYDSGTVGGVVNIITKKGSGEWHGFWDAYLNASEHKEEGATKRTSFSLTDPLGDEFSFHLRGSLDKVQVDARDINQGHQSICTRTYITTLPAGRERIISKDINSVVCWDFAPLQSLKLEAGYSHQGNLYMGDMQNTNSDTCTRSKYGNEINHLYRQNYSLTWNGGWDNGMTTNDWMQYRHTRNSHIPEGLAGGIEGKFNEKMTQDSIDTDLDDVTLHSEVNLPTDFLIN